jgi:hypothetical protein
MQDTQQSKRKQMTTTNNGKTERQPVTCGIFYCRVSAEIKVCSPLQTSSRLDSDELRNRQQKHTADR